MGRLCIYNVCAESILLPQLDSSHISIYVARARAQLKCGDEKQFSHVTWYI